MSDDPVLEVLSDIAGRMGNVEKKVEAIPAIVTKLDATHDQTVKTNGRVTALEEVEIRRKAIEEERARVAATTRQDSEDERNRRTFSERWLDRALTVALTIGVTFAGSLLHIL